MLYDRSWIEPRSLIRHQTTDEDWVRMTTQRLSERRTVNRGAPEAESEMLNVNGGYSPATA
jgi:hypothetical protein